ncbi:hypothetical protein DFJ58DRAFT_660860 [Suillus subalutaceus]|uniref:uncharacterized protein n=1 Tax=Suillus subalutaceus TaxID=48586 RepID=UPI001B87DF1E|nr:uncharacterized protein DFJ58DRAFT_660860 [Suillus subalutaceus]KAG1853459.1 hypothetical protein DFJ58DRAFT_660860 [Suillus subalutaceus]
MPRVSHWRYNRHFVPLTMHCEFPPERALDPPVLTQHKVFSREVNLIPPTMLGLPTPLTSSAPPKILKPRGEVSCVNRGGYNLQEKLGWSLSEYEEVRSFVIHLAHEHLNFFQRRILITPCLELLYLLHQAKSRYPVLKAYKDDWVVSDFLQVYLKNSSTRAN